jgi:hypothetical protein
MFQTPLKIRRTVRLGIAIAIAIAIAFVTPRGV